MEHGMAESLNLDKAALAWTLPWDADWVTAVTFLGPTRRVAAGNNLGQILLWDLPEKPGDPLPAPCRRLDGHTNVITRLLATPDGRWLISASYDHTIRFWDMQADAKGTEEVVLNDRAREEAGKRSGAKVPPPLTAQVELQQAERVLTEHKEWIEGLSLSGDGNLLVSGDDAGQIIIWDRPAGKEVRRWQTKGWVYTLALSPDAQHLLISERLPYSYAQSYPKRYGTAKLWDPATGQVRHELGALFPNQHMVTAAFSPDAKVLAIAQGGEFEATNAKVTLIDTASGKKLRELTPGHHNGATDVVFHPEGQHLASTGRDTVVRIWQAADGKMVKELGKPRGGQFKDWIHAVSVSPDGRWLAAADMAGQVQIWALKATS
jgi:WD40 repeat protein